MMLMLKRILLIMTFTALTGCASKVAHKFQMHEVNEGSYRILCRLDGTRSEEGDTLEGNPYSLFVSVESNSPISVTEVMLVEVGQQEAILNIENPKLLPIKRADGSPSAVYFKVEALSLKYVNHHVKLLINFNSGETQSLSFPMIYEKSSRRETDFMTKMRGV